MFRVQAHALFYVIQSENSQHLVWQSLKDIRLMKCHPKPWLLLTEPHSASNNVLVYHPPNDISVRGDGKGVNQKH